MFVLNYSQLCFLGTSFPDQSMKASTSPVDWLGIVNSLLPTYVGSQRMLQSMDATS